MLRLDNLENCTVAIGSPATRGAKKVPRRVGDQATQ